MMSLLSTIVYFIVLILVNLAYGVFILPVTRVLGFFLHKDLVSWYDIHCRTWGRILYKWGEIIFNVKLKIEGYDKLKPDKEYIVFSNHQSLIDIVLLFWLLKGQAPLRFVIKDSLKKIPVVGTATIGAKHCFITRTDRQFDLKEIEQLARRASVYPTSPVIFGDGSRAKDGEVIGQLKPYGTIVLLENLPDHDLLDVTIDGPGVARKINGLFNLWGRFFNVNIEVVSNKDIPQNREEKIKLLENLWNSKGEKIKSWRKQNNV